MPALRLNPSWRKLHPSKAAVIDITAFCPSGPSPLESVFHPIADQAGIDWYVKRDDLYAFTPKAPYQGNKVRKLLGVLAAHQAGKRLISFGGAFSNHLAALADIGQRLRLPTIGIVRGEKVDNPVLDFCAQAGMELHFISRGKYREKAKHTAAFLSAFGPGTLIPEGGSGPLAHIGTQQILPEVIKQLGQAPTVFQLAAGTGGTAAGVIASAQRPTQIEVFSVLKGNWMTKAIEEQLPRPPFANWVVNNEFHAGGYAKRPPALLDFCTSFTKETNIPVEPIYTGKLFQGVLTRMAQGHYPPGSCIVTYHSGGIWTY